jgi:RNA polymerase sigma-70 factor (ECF subfamily)
MLLSKVQNEHILLQRIAMDDEQAFRELFIFYHHEIGSFIHSLLHDRETTLEVVQDIFVKVWLNRTRLLEIDNFTAYLFITTRNHVLNKIRQSLREKEKHTSYLQSARILENIAPEEPQKIEERYQLLEKAVNNLPPQQQKVFTLRQQGLKNPEIAKVLNISTVSVAKYQQLALRFINDYVKAYGVITPLLYIYLS